LGNTRQATACWNGGRNSLLESAQEATLSSVAIIANKGQTWAGVVEAVFEAGKVDASCGCRKAANPCVDAVSLRILEHFARARVSDGPKKAGKRLRRLLKIHFGAAWDSRGETTAEAQT
jgi:hypothetical protein